MSQPIRVLVVFGTRPEIIKLAPVIAELRARDDVHVRVIGTGQHRELAQIALDAFGVTPDEELGLMIPGQTPAALNERILTSLGETFKEQSFDLVLVQGDTTTTFAAAQAAFYAKIPVGHVEAGLRSGHRYAPFPEEMNRRLVTQLATLHFTPTQRAAHNVRVGAPKDALIYVTGNTVIDALAAMVKVAPVDTIREKLGIPQDARILLSTIHRRESWGEPLGEIAAALHEIVHKYHDTALVLPLHPNPRVRDALTAALGDSDRVHLLDALAYPDFIALMAICHLVLSDSGGVQEEAPYFNKPVLVLRNETDRPEAIEAGTAVLGTTSRTTILRAANRLLSDASYYGKMSSGDNPFGDGQAARRIADAILHFFGRGVDPDSFA